VKYHVDFNSTLLYLLHWNTQSNVSKKWTERHVMFLPKYAAGFEYVELPLKFR
jgi:hypothetical protein